MSYFAASASKLPQNLREIKIRVCNETQIPLPPSCEKMTVEDAKRDAKFCYVTKQSAKLKELELWYSVSGIALLQQPLQHGILHNLRKLFIYDKFISSSMNFQSFAESLVAQCDKLEDLTWDFGPGEARDNHAVKPLEPEVLHGMKMLKKLRIHRCLVVPTATHGTSWTLSFAPSTIEELNVTGFLETSIEALSNSSRWLAAKPNALQALTITVAIIVPPYGWPDVDDPPTTWYEKIKATVSSHGLALCVRKRWTWDITLDEERIIA